MQTTFQENKIVGGGAVSPTPSSVPFTSPIQTTQRAVNCEHCSLQSHSNKQDFESTMRIEKVSWKHQRMLSKSVSKLTQVVCLFVLQFGYSIV